MTKLLIEPIYWGLNTLRLIFLSCRVGALLHNLVYLCLFRLASASPEQAKLTRLLKDSLRGQSRFVDWQHRVYTSCPATVKHALRQVFASRLLISGRRRNQLEKLGHVVPQKIMISLNTPQAGCNLACTHCYAKGYGNATLPLAVAKKVISEQERLGIGNVLLLGGEPFLYEGLWELFQDFPRTSFYVATNGTLLNRKTVARLARLGNVSPMISLEGFEATTDAIRGRGAYRRIIAAMRNCREAKLPYCVTVTVTRDNLREATSGDFLRLLDALRCCAVNYSCYVPVGKNAQPELALTEEESRRLDQVYDFILKNFPMHPAIGRNGTDRVSCCYAAAEYFHVLPTGQVEACPFAQWADPNYNIGRHTILDITASPLFAAIRELNKLGVPGLTACRNALFPSLQTMFIQLGAKPTSEQKEEVSYVIDTATATQPR